MSNIVEVTTTVETAVQAQSLAERLVDERLAACVQIHGPIQSVYRWQEQLCHATEYRCTIKSEKRLLPALQAAIRQIHPYQVPEILVFQVAQSSIEYAHWLSQQLRTE